MKKGWFNNQRLLPECHWKSIESGMNVTFRNGYHMHVPTLSKSTKEVYRMHGTWHSPNTLHNMVQAQSFCIITWNPPPPHRYA